MIRFVEFDRIEGFRFEAWRVVSRRFRPAEDVHDFFLGLAIQHNDPASPPPQVTSFHSFPLSDGIAMLDTETISPYVAVVRLDPTAPYDHARCRPHPTSATWY